MQYRAVLTDLDWTLIHNQKVTPHVIELLAEELEISRSTAEKIVGAYYSLHTSVPHYLHGYSKSGLWKTILGKYNIPYDPTIIYDINRLFWNTIAMRIQTFPGVLDTLKYLRHKGILIAIVSSGDYISRYVQIKSTGILPYIDTLVTSEEIGASKYERDLYLIAAKEMEADPQECLVVGDDEKGDIIPPKGDGFTTVKISRHPIESVADYILPSFASIIRLFN